MHTIRSASYALALGASMGASIGWAQSAETVRSDHQWSTYGGNLASQRYSPLDQIDENNFKDLRIAWR